MELSKIKTSKISLSFSRNQLILYTILLFYSLVQISCNKDSNYEKSLLEQLQVTFNSSNREDRLTAILMASMLQFDETTAIALRDKLELTEEPIERLALLYSLQSMGGPESSVFKDTFVKEFPSNREKIREVWNLEKGATRIRNFIPIIEVLESSAMNGNSLAYEKLIDCVPSAEGWQEEELSEILSRLALFQSKGFLESVSKSPQHLQEEIFSLVNDSITPDEKKYLLLQMSDLEGDPELNSVIQQGLSILTQGIQ